MSIINIRGTSGSGKSTLVKRFLDEYPWEPIITTLGPWKKPKTVAYRVFTSPVTFVIGRYDTACGGCDSMSYKGSHTDIEELVRGAADKGNVIYEGLTISSTISRWKTISADYPGRFVWMFMDTPVDICHTRILARSGREPKRNEKGLADYQIKHGHCLKQVEQLLEAGEHVVEVSSDEEGYETLLRELKILRA